MVQGFRDRFEKVIATRKIDYLFCNREEAIALVGEDFADELKQIAVNFAVTNGAENSIVFDAQIYQKSMHLKSMQLIQMVLAIFLPAQHCTRL